MFAENWKNCKMEEQDVRFFHHLDVYEKKCWKYIRKVESDASFVIAQSSEYGMKLHATIESLRTVASLVACEIRDFLSILKE